MRKVTELIERIANLLRAEERSAGTAHGLQPVHWQVLDYLARCNRYSNTPAGVTDYLGLTKGTVSQTLLVLEKKELIAKQPDSADRRLVHLRVTPQGQALLESAQPVRLFTQATTAMTAQELSRLENGLTRLLQRLQQARGGRSFGVCRTCRFFQREAAGYRCGLTQEALSDDDGGRLCREHEAPSTRDRKNPATARSTPS
jgi:DNA-binding MarR family transcriptional regulator